MGQVTLLVPGIVVWPDGIDVQEEGMVTEVSWLHPLKEDAPIDVTADVPAKDSEASLLHPEKTS